MPASQGFQPHPLFPAQQQPTVRFTAHVAFLSRVSSLQMSPGGSIYIGFPNGDYIRTSKLYVATCMGKPSKHPCHETEWEGAYRSIKNTNGWLLAEQIHCSTGLAVIPPTETASRAVEYSATLRPWYRAMATSAPATEAVKRYRQEDPSKTYGEPRIPTPAACCLTLLFRVLDIPRCDKLGSDLHWANGCELAHRSMSPLQTRCGIEGSDRRPSRRHPGDTVP